MINLILFLAFAWRFATLGMRPFDGDEGAMILIGQNWAEFIQKLSKDIHPPLYPFLLGIITHLFGVSEFWARFLSALSGVLLVYFIYLLIGKIFEQKTALFASTLAAFSPYLLFFDQEARMYSLFALLSAVSFFLFLLLLAKENFKRWLAFGLVNLLLVLTHHLGWFWLAFYFVYLLIKRRQLLLHYIYKLLALLLVWGLYLPLFLNQISGRLLEQPLKVSFFDSFLGVAGAVFRFGAGRLFLDLKNEFGFLPLLIFLIFLWFFIRGLREKKSDFLKALFLFFVLVLILSVFVSEIGPKATRYLIFLFPIYLIFVAKGVIASRGRWFWTLLIFLIFFAADFDHFARENRAAAVDRLAAKVLEEQKEGDALVLRGSFTGGEEFVFNYYYQKLNKEKKPQLLVVDMLGDYYQPGNLHILRQEKPATKIKEILQSQKRVWFYDVTYAKNPLEGLPEDLKVSKINLGLDKEKKDLVLWQISRPAAETGR